MNQVATKIKEIIEAQGLTYLRSVNINDLNEQVGNIDLSAGVGVYSSLPEIENINYVGGSVLMNYSIEVYYLLPSFETDDKGDQVDQILDFLKPSVDAFTDLMAKSDLISLDATVEGSDVDAIETLKLTKEVLTGWRIRLILPIDRSVFYCQKVGTFTDTQSWGVDQLRINGATNFIDFIIGDTIKVTSDDGIYNNITAVIESVNAGNGVIFLDYPYISNSGAGTYSKIANG